MVRRRTIPYRNFRQLFTATMALIELSIDKIVLVVCGLWSVLFLSSNTSSYLTQFTFIRESQRPFREMDKHRCVEEQKTNETPISLCVQHHNFEWYPFFPSYRHHEIACS